MLKTLSRSFAAIAFAVWALPALAFEILPYSSAEAEADITAGKPVVIHVFAPWCLQCRAQESILNRLKADPAYDALVVYRVDYDNQKDVVKAFDVPRSTLIAYKGGKEVAKVSWGTTEAWVREVLAKVE